MSKRLFLWNDFGCKRNIWAGHSHRSVQSGGFALRWRMAFSKGTGIKKNTSICCLNKLAMKKPPVNPAAFGVRMTKWEVHFSLLIKFAKLLIKMLIEHKKRNLKTQHSCGFQGFKLGARDET